MSQKVSAVLLAAGLGERFGGDRNKPFAELAGRSLISHSLEKLRASEVVGEIIVVMSKLDRERDGGAALRELETHQIDRVVTGGARRQDSSFAGFQATSESAEIVIIHDAVRPFASPRLIRNLVAAAEEFGAATPALPSADSVKEAAGGFLVRSIPRSVVYLTQTPQAFRRPLLAKMFREVEKLDIDVTDDAEMAEVAGIRVRIVEGERTNLKITTPDDLLLAELLHRRLGTRG